MVLGLNIGVSSGERFTGGTLVRRICLLFGRNYFPSGDLIVYDLGSSWYLLIVPRCDSLIRLYIKLPPWCNDVNRGGGVTRYTCY